MAVRVSSSRFVGRAEQLAELCSALEDAATAHPSLAFVAGESGAGKTRLRLGDEAGDSPGLADAEPDEHPSA